MSKFNFGKQQVKVETKFTNIRNFSYSKGEVSLNFSLNMDGKKQVSDFKECLEEALKDLNEILEK